MKGSGGEEEELEEEAEDWWLLDQMRLVKSDSNLV
jgi:hypothetical protein